MRKPTAHTGGGRRRAYVAFAGGGAKGIVHVGALRALEESDLEFKGLAGTSIGAVIAALAAAGYRADDLVNPRRKRTIMRRITQIDPTLRKPTDFFGTWRWPIIRVVRIVVRRPWRLFVVAVGLLVVPPVGFVVSREWPAATIIFVTVWGVLALVGAAALTLALNGIGRLTKFRRVLNRLLQRKLFPRERYRIVKMGDFDGQAAPLLKIVAANLTKGSLELFSAERTPDVSVSRAVVASMSLPVIFSLPRVAPGAKPGSSGDLCTDGGIVSNLPAWPFDEERELDPDAVTIAVEIPDRAERKAPRRMTWPLALLRTGFFGGGELDLRAANAMVHLPLEAQVGLLDFDMGLDKVFATVADARRASELILSQALLRDPQLFQEVCQGLHTVSAASFAASPKVLPQGPGRVRVAIAEPEPGYSRSLRISHVVGFGEGPDQAILLPNKSVAGKAWLSGTPQIERAPFKALAGHESQHVRRLMRSDLKWIFCVPIFGPDQRKRFVACFDGNTDLSDTDETVDLFKELGRVTQEILGPFLFNEEENGKAAS